MNHEQYIRKQLEKNLSGNPCRARNIQRKIIQATLFLYKANNYLDIDDLLHEAMKSIKEYRAIGRGTTAAKFAIATGVSKTTARLHLLSLEHIVRNETKKPYIYTVGKI